MCFISHSDLNKNSLALSTKEYLFTSSKTPHNITMPREIANFHHSDFCEKSIFSFHSPLRLEMDQNLTFRGIMYMTL